jgi:hypothetical protein
MRALNVLAAAAIGLAPFAFCPSAHACATEDVVCQKNQQKAIGACPVGPAGSDCLDKALGIDRSKPPMTEEQWGFCAENWAGVCHGPHQQPNPAPPPPVLPVQVQGPPPPPANSFTPNCDKLGKQVANMPKGVALAFDVADLGGADPTSALMTCYLADSVLSATSLIEGNPPEAARDAQQATIGACDAGRSLIPGAPAC